MSTVRIRRAHPADASRLSALALTAKKHWGYPDAWLHAWSEQLTFRPDYVGEAQVYIATDSNERPVACYALAAGENAVELDHLWVHPDYVGRGIGRLMFLHAVETARELGRGCIYVDSDPHAEGFYKRMGAERVGEVPADVCGTRRVLPRLRILLT